MSVYSQEPSLNDPGPKFTLQHCMTVSIDDLVGVVVKMIE